MTIEGDRNSKFVEEFLSCIVESNRDTSTICDFNSISAKAFENSEKCNFHFLRGILGLSEDKLVEFIEKIGPENLKIPILKALSLRNSSTVISSTSGICESMDTICQDPNKLASLIEKSGLLSFFHKHKNIDIESFILGVEAGLDTNSRKNRGGDWMTAEVVKILKEEEITKGISWESEVRLSKLPELGGVSPEEDKIVDFVIKLPDQKVYIVESNFFNEVGSKQSEVVRSYSKLSSFITNLGCSKIDFIWITDGGGWKKQKNLLLNAKESVSILLNLKMFKDFINGL